MNNHKESFFDAEPRDHKYRDNQAAISADYRLCYAAMAAGKEDDRQYLSVKFGRPLDTVGQLSLLGQELFALLGDGERAYDSYHAQRTLATIGQDEDMDIA